MRKAAIAGALSILLGSPCLTTAQAYMQGFGDSGGISPYDDWQTFETRRVRIHHPRELAETAVLAARYFEEAHAALAPWLEWEPTSPVEVVLYDPLDSANGLTSPLEGFGIHLYATPPESWFTTNRYDDWLKLLVIHEYTHYLNLDATHGGWAIARRLLGPLLLPNGTWPSWMLEGLAVTMETRLTNAGRGRSPQWDALLRAFVRDGQVGPAGALSLDRISASYPYFPEGEMPYLFGYGLMSELAAEEARPEASYGKLSTESASSVPYLWDEHVGASHGTDWDLIWARWLKKTESRQHASLKTVRSAEVTRPRILETILDEVRAPRLSPDGSLLVFAGEGPSRRTGLWVRDLESGENRRLSDQALGAGAAFLPDSQTLITSALRRRGGYRTFTDLAAIDARAPSDLHFLTSGLRARDPDVSKDGKQLVFALTENENVGIATAPLTGSLTDGDLAIGPIRRLFFGGKFSRAAQPRFSPDGTKVVFSFHPHGVSREDLLILDLATGKAEPVRSNGSYNRYPFFISDAELAFVSDQTGIDNLWSLRIDPSGKPVTPPVLRTNLETGLSFPTRAAGGRFYSSYLTGEGWKLSEFTPLRDSPDPGVVTITPPELPWRATPTSAAVVSSQHQNSSEAYSSLSSLGPRIFVPSFSSGAGSTQLGGTFLGYDSLDFIEYSFSPGYDFSLQAPVGGLGVSWRKLGPTLTLSASTDVAGDRLAYFRTMDVAASLARPFYFTFSRLTPSLRASAERAYTVIGGEPLGASEVLPVLDFKFQFSNPETSRTAFTTERGFSGFIAARTVFTPAGNAWKGYLSYAHPFPIVEQTIVRPALRAALTSRISNEYSLSNIVTVGRTPTLTGGLSADDLDQFALRGYPGKTFQSRNIVLPSLDLTVPLTRVFTGRGMIPFFFRDLALTAFAENAAFLTSASGVVSLPSSGIGIRSRSTLFHYAPLVIGLELHHGFRPEYDGKTEVFVSIASGLPF